MTINDLLFVDGVCQLNIGDKHIEVVEVATECDGWLGVYQILVWVGEEQVSSSGVLSESDMLKELVSIGLQGCDI